MGLKEIDQVRMIGIIPAQGADPIPVGKIPDGGTQISVSDTIANDTSIVYTNTTGNTAYISATHFHATNISGAWASGSLFVTDASDNLLYTLSYGYLPDSEVTTSDRSYLPPLEILNGYKVKITSSVANMDCEVHIHGYEI